MIGENCKFKLSQRDSVLGIQSYLPVDDELLLTPFTGVSTQATCLQSCQPHVQWLPSAKLTPKRFQACEQSDNAAGHAGSQTAAHCGLIKRVT